MADSYIQVPPDSTGKKVDAASFDVGANTVMRQRIVLGDNTGTATFATILSSGPAGTEGGLVVRNIPSGIQGVSNVAGTANIGGVSLVAGTANIGFINNISATVIVAGIVSLGAGTNLIGAVSNAAGTALMGAVSLAAGTANIGFINNISATVVVAGEIANGSSLSSTNKPVLIGGNDSAGGAGGIMRTLLLDTSGRVILGAGAQNIGTINNISANVNVVIAAGTNNIGTINNISAAVTVNPLNISNTPSVILAAGTANFGTLNNISATVNTGLSFVIEKTTNSQVQVGDSANAAVRVNVVAGSAGGPSMIDNTTFSTGASNLAPAGFIHFSASATTMTDGRIGAARITAQRGLHVNLRTDTGTAMDDVANNALRVNVVAGSAGGPSIIDNTTYSTGATSIAGAGFIFFSASATLVTDGRMAAARITDSRAIHSNLRNNAGTEIGTSTTPLSVKVENQSATVSVILAAGTANFGTLNNISASVLVATGATADFNTLASADQIQTLPIFGIALPASGGAVAGGTTTNPIIVGGTVSLGGSTANIGTVNNISAAVVLAAGSANIGFINNISATVVVSGTVSLGASTANIGTINNISAAVVLAAGAANIGSINNISATVNTVVGAGTQNIGGVSLVAGTANIGFINNISANVKVVGTVASGASITTGDAPVQLGFRVNISAPAALGSAQATFAWADKFGRPIVQINHPSLLPTASHGPICVVCSTSATTALVVAPGAGLSIYITKIACTNGSGTLTRADVYRASATASTLAAMYMAASGGGFTMDYNPPIQVLSNTAVNARVKPSVSQCIYNIHFYVGPK